MAKTINPQMDFFLNPKTAERAFIKSKVPCHLLQSSFVGKPTWFIDRSKKALEDWPQHYKLVSEK